MPASLAMVTLVVRDYDEAIEWFTDVLGFELREDEPRGGGKRWVVVAPRGDHGARLLLAKAVNPEQSRSVGAQTGGRVGFFLHTADFAGDYERMRASGVHFTEEPRREPYGRVVVFTDLYGNRWDLIGPEA